MIIKPTFIDNDIREYKYLSYKANNQRYDSVHIDSSKIIKSTYFGTNNDFNDFIRTETDLKTGEVLKILSSVKGQKGGWSEVKPSNYINPNLVGSKVANSKVFDNSYFQTQINVYEDEFNLSFTDTIGPLLALLSGSTIAIPFRLAIIIDTKMGIIIKDFYNTLDYIESTDISKNILIEFVKSLNIINKRFTDICKKEKRNMRVLVYIGDFGVTSRVIDTDYNISTIYELNNSDHCRILRTIDAHVGSSYVHSDPFGLLYESKCVTLIPSLFEFDEDQENFLYRLDGENYETSYF